MGFFVILNTESYILDQETLTKNEKNYLETKGQEYSFVRIIHNENRYSSLEDASYQAYKKIFDYMSNNKEYNFLRAWNYIPDILRIDDLERYRKFNLGRWNAWQDFGPKFKNGIPIRPAATAIGSVDGPLIVEALFSKYPVIYLENPRQKQFVEYSEKWGKKPPISARGTLHMHPDSPEIFIAGTASLLGEEVAHPEDVSNQTKETLRNIKTLISKENLKNYGVDFGFKIQNLQGIRVYVKNPETDLKIIKKILEKEFTGKDILYLHDDICRPGFLIEIEAIAR